ncbi:MAG: energy transducer TonB [Bacteroidota bacterium]
MNLQESEWSEPSACSNCVKVNGKKVDGSEAIKKIVKVCESGKNSKWYILKHEAKAQNVIYFTVFGKASHDIRFNTFEEAMQYIEQNANNQCGMQEETNFASDDTIYEEKDDIDLPTFEECMNIEDKREKWICERKLLEKKYIKYLKYPAAARENGVEGVVKIGIVIEKDGTASATEILEDIGSECGQAALTAINEALAHNNLRWIPAKKNGIPVRSRMMIPVKFWLVK